MTPFHRHADRRGAILLISLTALTFFIMIGTLLLITATRTRATARAFADVATSSAATAAQADAILDEALLVVLRGRKDQAVLPQAMQHQSLLQDKYGPQLITGTATAGSVVPLTLPGPLQGSPAILQAEISSLTDWQNAPMTPPPHPCDLNGRVLTFKPQPDDGDPASYRILRTVEQSGRITVYLANTPTGRSPLLPKKDCAVIINGREFTIEDPTNPNAQNEPWDGFDADNAWLAQVDLDNSKVKQVPRPSFSGTAPQPPVCDNDNDGVADGIWISGTAATGHSPNGICPDRPSPLGGVLQFDFSFHIVDLDGRVNVNAHGSPTLMSQNAADWPATFMSMPIGGVPAGLGYGPADVDASRLFSTGSQTTGMPGFPGQWHNLCQDGTPAKQSGGNTIQRRPTPQVGSKIEGRYGPADTTSGSNRWVPGKSGSTLDPMLQASIGGTVVAGNANRAAGNSPTDLHARMKMFVQPASAGAPRLFFYTPIRGANDMLESPYELRLDVDAARPQQLRQSGTAAPADNVFTPAELERVLRQFDPDASTLPPRLAALLDDYAQRSRMTITTDSWDTPVISGTAMIQIRDALRALSKPTAAAPSLGNVNAARVYDLFSPDVVAGLRFDLNRPLSHPAVPATDEPAIKERYCRHLYTLLVALGQPASRETAQWVANVVDFRDADSTMTRFRYDTNLTDGWNVDDATYVFGAERPEMVITETVAWDGKLAVVLYHPWDARVVDPQTPSNPDTNSIPVEKVDPNLASTTSPTALDLARKGAGSDSIWQIRVLDQAGSQVLLADQAPGGNDPRFILEPNQHICIQTDAGMGAAVPSITAAAFAPGPPGPGTVVLERLADPTKPWENDPAEPKFNPYVEVDRARLKIADDQQTAARHTRTDSRFWTQRQWDPGADGDTVPQPYGNRIPWFHWPNRPFIGAAELALVPTGDASAMLASGTAPSPAQRAASLILDAVHVPSRFVGSAQQIGDDALLRSAVTNEEVCTTMLPRWREPGRINVNTAVGNPNNTPADLDNGVWQALLGPGAATIASGSNPFAASQPAKSVAEMLTLQSSGSTVYYEPVTAGLTARNDNDFFRYARAIRLSNAATIRSHVIAVWITLRITDTSPAASAPVYRRMFAIVDRSIPVGFAPGETLNVRDTIRLQRFLD